MKRILQGAVLPFALFASAIILMACDTNVQSNANDEQSPSTAAETQTAQSTQHRSASETPLKSGNYFYIATDVASMQTQAGQYVSQIQSAQEQLQQALANQNPTELQNTATHLNAQLKAFNQTLNQLDLKSAEIDSIRQNIMKANTEVLSSPYLNGQVDLSQVDFTKIEQQMNSVQNEMFKLAAILMSPTQKDAQSE